MMKGIRVFFATFIRRLMRALFFGVATTGIFQIIFSTTLGVTVPELLQNLSVAAGGIVFLGFIFTPENYFEK